MTPYCAPPNPSLTAEARSPSKSPCTTARGGRRESCQSLTTRALHHSQVEFDDVVMSFLFLIAVWVGGKAAAGMRMPSLVGELAVGLVMGPPLLDVVPLAEALMLYGEVGLLLLVRRCRPSAVRRSQWTPGIGIQKAAAASSELLSTRSAQRALRHSQRRNLMRLRMPAQVLEAGLDADLPMMRTVGPRGVAIALCGTCLPVCIAAGLGRAVLGLDRTDAKS